jgi:Hsp20/alpha crystallin family
MLLCDALLQKEQAFEIKADVPGVDKKDIKLSVDGDVLSLSVQKTQAKEVSRTSNDCALLRQVGLLAVLADTVYWEAFREYLPLASAEQYCRVLLKLGRHALHGSLCSKAWSTAAT